jgi:hypothetical protein
MALSAVTAIKQKYQSQETDVDLIVNLILLEQLLGKKLASKFDLICFDRAQVARLCTLIPWQFSSEAG